MDKSRVPEFALLGLLALLWGGSYLFIKVAVTEIPPLTLIAIRAGVAAIVVLAVLAVRRGRLPRDPGTWGRLFIQSLLNATLAWTLLAWGQQHIDAGPASVLNSTSPLFVFFSALLITKHEAASTLRLIGALLGVAGVALIVGVEALSGLGYGVAGQIAALLSAALYGAAAIHGRRLSHIGPVATACGTMIWAFVILAPAALIVDAPWTLSPSWEALGAAVALGFFSTAIALLIYFRLIASLGAMGVASQAYLRAGVGVMLGVIVLGETVPPTLAIGVLAALIGVAVINWRRA